MGGTAISSACKGSGCGKYVCLGCSDISIFVWGAACKGRGKLQLLTSSTWISAQTKAMPPPPILFLWLLEGKYMALH
eukprot:1154012-Pelagomonas_calceolata.AAC.4